MKQQIQTNKIEWKEVEIGELLDYEQPGKYIVEGEILKKKTKNSIPVLTANKSFILGYTEEKVGIYENSPVIIFDDFTTDTKFVDFKFKVKSSAMKLLRPKSKDINLKFVFLMMKGIQLNFSTHKRYYLSVYQIRKILMPFKDGKHDLKEQERVVKILEDSLDLNYKGEKVENLLSEYLKSVFYEMFGDPILKESQYDKISFLKCLEKEASNNKLKLQQKDFLEKGKYPIIDQGEKFIAGYTNNKGKVYLGKLPAIIFGDHTRILKFVTFPFALGADGVKILVPNKNFDPVYFYYCLKLLNIESAGYSRHYKFLKQKEIPLPPLPLQEKFASIVEQIEKMKENINKTKQNSEELFNSLISKAFGGEL